MTSAPPPLPDQAKCPNCGAPLPDQAVQGLCPKCLYAGLAAATEDEMGAPAQGPVQTPEELAPHFPQLEIQEYLGRGGMGVVYKARQKSLNRLVALKLLAPERVTDAKFAQRFTQEAHSLATLNHPNIVTIYDFGQAGGFYFLLMEFVDGVNLRQAMKAGRFTPEQALAVVPPVCEALQYAHEHGIVHRDIKPENLLLDKSGRVKIADFGIAKILGTESAAPSSPGPRTTSPGNEGTLESAAGTPQYMAPEQKEHRTTDHRADIYSLGVVLYELLTGELPAEKIQPPSSRIRGMQIDVRLDEIVLRALEKAPELRYQTAGEFRTRVETMANTPRASPGAEAKEPRGLRRFSKRSVFLLAAMLLLGLFLVPLMVRRASLRESAARSNWVSISDASKPGETTLDGTRKEVSMTWEVKTPRPGTARLVRGSSRSTTDLVPDRPTKTYHTTVRLELTAIDGNRVQLVLQMGDATVREELRGSFMSLADQMLATVNTSAKQKPGTNIELCRLDGTPLSIIINAGRVPAAGSSGLKVNFLLLGLLVLLGSIAAVVVIFFLRTSPARKIALSVGVVVLALLGVIFAVVFALVGSKLIAREQGRAMQFAPAKADNQLEHRPGFSYHSRGNHSVKVAQDNSNLHYVFYFAGKFTSSTSGSRSTQSLQWKEEGGIKLSNGRTFGFHRDSTDPLRLSVNGREYDLRAGRVFVLREGGTAEQLDLSPSLGTAKNPEELAKLISARAPAGQSNPAPQPASTGPGAPAATGASRTFPLRHKLASEMADDLRQILLGKPGHEAKPSPDNQEVQVIAPLDVIMRAQTFITVNDWPDGIARGSNFRYPQDSVVRAARSFFYACAIEDDEEVFARLLTPGVLAALKGDTKSEEFENYQIGGVPDASWEKSLRADWPGRNESIQRLIREWNRYPLKRLTEQSGVAIGFGVKHFCSISFEGAPKAFYDVTIEPDRTKPRGSEEAAFLFGSLPPWWNANPDKNLEPIESPPPQLGQDR